MNGEMDYLNEEGQRVFTSHYLKKKGTCCRSGCLHCPYGFTVKKFGLQFAPASDYGQEWLNLTSADSFDMGSFKEENRKVILLKNKVCGALVHNHLVIKKMWLFPTFGDQGLSKELIESYLFN